MFKLRPTIAIRRHGRNNNLRHAHRRFRPEIHAVLGQIRVVCEELLERNPKPHGDDLANVLFNNIVVPAAIWDRTALGRQRRQRGRIVRACGGRADGIGNGVCAAGGTATDLLDVVEVVADTEDVGVPGEELGLRYVGSVFGVDLADG